VDHSSLGFTVESRWPCLGLVQPIGKNWMGVLNDTEYSKVIYCNENYILRTSRFTQRNITSK